MENENRSEQAELKGKIIFGITEVIFDFVVCVVLTVGVVRYGWFLELLIGALLLMADFVRESVALCFLCFTGRELNELQKKTTYVLACIAIGVVCIFPLWGFFEAQSDVEKHPDGMVAYNILKVDQYISTHCWLKNIGYMYQYRMIDGFQEKWSEYQKAKKNVSEMFLGL